MEEHLDMTALCFEKLFSMLPVKTGVDAEAFGAAFRAVYIATLHKAEIRGPHYESALRLLIHGLVLQLL